MDLVYVGGVCFVLGSVCTRQYLLWRMRLTLKAIENGETEIQIVAEA